MAGIVLLAAPVFYILLIAFYVSIPTIRDYTERQPFKSDQWKNWTETEAACCARWRMVRDLQKRYELVGMTRAEVIDLLGSPDQEGQATLYYYLGMTGHGIDSGTLSLYLNEAGEVDRYDVWHG